MQDTTNKWTAYRHKKIAKQREEIVALLTKGKSRWEVYKLGYPWSTIRYHYDKLYRPKKHKKNLAKMYELRQKS